MSGYNLAGTIGTEVGAALTAALGVGADGNYERLWLLVLLCNLSSLLPLPFLGLLAGIDGADLVQSEPPGDHGAPRATPQVAGRAAGDQES